ncbi:hypothetical protein [Paenarthrobacter aromaticivorans]
MTDDSVQGLTVAGTVRTFEEAMGVFEKYPGRLPRRSTSRALENQMN